jgi:ABC-type polar amino acid transport system ATPase subunit
VVFMDHGTIVEDTDWTELFAHPRGERATQFLSRIPHP